MMKLIEDYPLVAATVAWVVVLATCALILWRLAQFFIEFVNGWRDAEAKPRGFDVLQKEPSDPQCEAGRQQSEAHGATGPPDVRAANSPISRRKSANFPPPPP
jgi:hypothetical protein